MDGINITWTRLVTEVYIHQDIFNTLRHRYLKALFFGRKRLDAGVPDQPEFFIRSKGHDRAAAVGRLGHVNFFFLKKLLSLRLGCGHFQDHPGSGGSTIRDTVPGLAGNPYLDYRHGLVLSFFHLKDITQGLYFQRQGLP